MRHVIQILLPLYDNCGQRFDAAEYASVRGVLTEQFGGMTAYSRAPAEGLWEKQGAVLRDDILVFEVMADELDREWWAQFRRRLERQFRQDAIVVRAQQCETL